MNISWGPESQYQGDIGKTVLGSGWRSDRGYRASRKMEEHDAQPWWAEYITRPIVMGKYVSARYNRAVSYAICGSIDEVACSYELSGNFNRDSISRRSA